MNLNFVGLTKVVCPNCKKEIKNGVVKDRHLICIDCYKNGTTNTKV